MYCTLVGCPVNLRLSTDLRLSTFCKRVACFFRILPQYLKKKEIAESEIALTTNSYVYTTT